VDVSVSKDRSDLFFAAIAALEAGATELLCLGVTGGRADHHLATLMDLSNFAAGSYGPLQSVEAYGPDGQFIFLSTQIPHWQAVLKRHQLVSIFALSPYVEGLTLSGFRYHLKQVKMNASSWGLSNQVVKRKCEVHLRKGKLLVIIPVNGIA
jgi:thiamine pyrophosphokinase